MATITTDTFLDGGTARTAGEAWTINNNAKLTVRTDTRWHANAPASMTGSLGSITGSATQGGTVFIDGTKVRWMPYDTGSGNVPAIGTTVTQGGVSGYLLGVWTDYVSAPTAVGAAMPASGYLKFREVTGGTYSIGALTGIGANATEADRVGWIEVVGEVVGTSTSLSMGALGKFMTVGDWFYLGTTSGSRHQVVPLPINGGTTSYLGGVQIETSPGSDEYDWYSGEMTTQMFTTARYVTDARSKAVLMNGTGITIGGDGTNSIAYLPVAGCKIRIPNIILRVATTAARATNLFPDTTSFGSPNNYNFGTSFTEANIQNCIGCWELNGLGSVNKVVINNSAFDNMNNRFNSTLTELTLQNSLFSVVKGIQFSQASSFGVDACENVTITNCKTKQGYANGGGGSLAFTGVYRSTNVTISNLTCVSFFSTTDQKNAFFIVNCNTISVDDLYCIGGSFEIQSSVNVTVTNYDFTWSVAIATTNSTATSTLARQGIILANNSNLILSNVTLGLKGILPDVQPFLGLILINGTAGQNSIRNIGTRSAPLNTGSNATYHPDYLVRLSTGTKNVKIQRVYCTGVRNNIIIFENQLASSNIVAEHVYATFAKTFQLQTKNSIFRNLGATNTTTASYAIGSHWIDHFTSDTLGIVQWSGMLPSSLTSGENFIITTGTSQYTPQNTQVLLNTVGDYFYAEMIYFIKGHTSFRNLAPTITGTNTNLVTYEYQIDTGSGWNGTWKTISGTNLFAETISPAGFKLKYRGTQTSAGIAQITSIQVFTNSTLTDQANNLYPLDTAQLSFTGLIPGSEVRVYSGTDPATAVEVAGTEATGGSTFSLSHSVAGTDGTIVILAMGYQPIYLPYTFKSTDDSILIQPVVDRNYVNPV